MCIAIACFHRTSGLHWTAKRFQLPAEDHKTNEDD